MLLSFLNAKDTINGHTIADTTQAAATCAVAAAATTAKAGSVAATAAGVATALPAVDPVARPMIGSSLNILSNR